jgi:hypothetical protein
VLTRTIRSSQHSHNIRHMGDESAGLLSADNTSSLQLL